LSVYINITAIKVSTIEESIGEAISSIMHRTMENELRRHYTRGISFAIISSIIVGLADGVGLPPGYQASTGPMVHWSYADKANWPVEFKQFCGGQSQSPVALDSSNSQYDTIFPFTFSNYGTAPTKQTATNNGHTVTVTFEAASVPAISNGGLPDNGPYNLAQYHFHWGAVETRGSEHTINSVRYPMEMHFVHFKAAYGSVANAITHSDGLAVLGVMFELSDNDNPNMKPLIDVIPSIVNEDATADLASNLAFENLLPKDTKNFYHYSGSLTTPLCNEIVTWTVFRDTLPISKAQLDVLRTLKGDNGTVIADNYRDLQPINQRTITRTFTS